MPRDNKQDLLWRKKRTKASREPPLPVPIGSITSGLPSRQTWYCYTGYLQGSTVVVKHSGDVDFLYRMGFFGKGTLSRSEPNFDSRRSKVNILLPSGATASEEREIAGLPVKSIEVAVTTKRSYLRHLQYKALEEDDESGYNELVEQETMQRYKDGEEEDELEEEEEESYESDSSDPLATRQQSAFEDGIHLPKESSEYRSVLISLLSQVAQLSKEKIATFIKVPQTLHQLEIRFQKLRQRQFAIVEGGDRLIPSNPSRHTHRSSSQDVIDLRELDESDDVVILNSDDNSKGSEDQTKRTRSNQNKADQTFKSWEDPDNKGDASFWGMGASKINDKIATEEQKLSSKTDDVSDKPPVSETNLTSISNCSEANGDECNKEQEKSDPEQKDMGIENDKSEDNKTEEEEDVNHEMVVENPNDEETSTGISNDAKSESSPVKVIKDDDLKEAEVLVIANSTKSTEGPSSSKISFLGSGKNNSGSQNNVQNSSSFSVSKDSDSDDSDDVICVENESAEPAKLHDFLSQSSFSKQALPFPLDSKMVRFMTNISKEPKFVNAKVGFRSWTNILHFNYSGDEAHLPTSLEVLQDEGRLDRGVNSALAERNAVYERIYPPINSLMTNPDSKGVVIKQRLEEIPHLDIAKRNVLGSTSRTSHHSSGSTHISSSLNKTPHHKQTHKKIFSRPFQNKTSHSNSSLLHQKSSLFESEKKEAFSLSSSDFAQYIGVFQRGLPSRSGGKSGSGGNKGDSTDAIFDDEDLSIICKELDKVKELSLNSNQTEGGRELVTEKDRHFLKFNQLLSGYLTKTDISLIKELALLKILVCGSENDTEIPEDVITKTKSCLSPEENSYLLDRLDFVQSCLASFKESSEDVIMIDLSDDEQNEDKINSNDLKTQRSVAPFIQVMHSQHPRKESKEVVSHERDLMEEASSMPLKKPIVTGDTTDLSKKNVINKKGDVLPGKKRSWNELKDHEPKTDSKISKLDFPCLEKESSSCNGSHTSQKSHTPSNRKNTDENISKEEENGKPDGDGDIQPIIKKSDGSSNINKDISTEKERDSPSENVCHEIGAVSEESSPEKHPSNFGNEDEVSADISLDQSRIYIESSDEEEESHPSRKPRSGFQTREHPYSVKDNLMGDILVAPNTSDEEEEDKDSSSTYKFTWQPCVKKDPYPSTEQLQLLLEEAFFLTFGLGCLNVYDPEKKAMSITEMWQQFPLLKDNFIPHYVAYHYFRSKGWVPKSGLKFGCDFVLYREGPPYFHGSYSVVVVAVQEGSLTPMIGDEGGLDYPQRLNTWITLAGLNRVTEHVAKELMYCYVICPKNLTEEESKSPKCMSRFRVKEIVMSRWVSSKERENKEKEEIP